MILQLRNMNMINDSTLTLLQFQAHQDILDTLLSSSLGDIFNLCHLQSQALQSIHKDHDALLCLTLFVFSFPHNQQICSSWGRIKHWILPSYGQGLSQNQQNQLIKIMNQTMLAFKVFISFLGFILQYLFVCSFTFMSTMAIETWMQLK